MPAPGIVAEIPGEASVTCVCLCVLSRVRLSTTPWTVVRQAPLSRDFPGKNTGMDCHFLPQGIFPTQESNPDHLHCGQILYLLSYEGSPRYRLDQFEFPEEGLNIDEVVTWFG